jgi:subtilisin family serine protease/peptidoglycan hydrolase-like protein with peptidoglycan-binding domain
VVDPALWELLRAEAGTDGTGVIEAIIRFARPGIEIPDVQIVSRFGAIATCRLRARDVIAVRARPEVVSLKAARGLDPGSDPAAPEMPGPAQPGVLPTDLRRSPALTLTGAGVVVAAADWGVDVDSAAFRWPAVPATADTDRGPGGTRFLSFWDQRDQAAGPRPDRYGYGTVHDRDEIDRALQGPRPYELLGYHPAIADSAGLGTHGTHVLDIAAGNGQAGGPAGIAPDADLIFVHLADRNTGGLANFGDSVRLLEAIDFISATAGSQPCVINISAGRICGPKDGTTLVERAFDELLTDTPGRFIVNSAGNYFRRRAHAHGTIAPGEARSLSFVIDPADITLNELEIWYDGADEFAVRVDPPGHVADRTVGLGERSDLIVEGRTIGRVYHRKHDPNNGDNHIVAFIDPIGHAGTWTITLEARQVSSGRFDAWIERDDSCPGCQARFTRADSNSATTIGSITTSHLPLVVGAYDGHDPARPAAPFTSGGPSRDQRPKPDLAAPGVAVLAARSAPAGASRNPGLLSRKSGTSMATPHVTGAVALCLQAAGTRLGAGQIRSLVLGSCDPAPGADRYRLGRGYLNIPRLIAGLQQALAAPAGTRGAKEPAMDTDDIIAVLAAAPATAYREYLYRPHGRVARWIANRFEVVARPGQRIGQPPRPGDVLLQVRLGRLHPGRCVVLGDRDQHLAATPAQLAPGQLLLRPRRRAALTGPLPVEPAAEFPYLTPSLAAEPGAAGPADDPTEAITPVTTLTSPRFAGDSDLDAVANGTLRLAAPGTSPYPAPVLSQGPAIAKIQQALIDLGYPLPTSGADGRFGPETGGAVTKYKTDRSITPNDPVMGRQTMALLDHDIFARDSPLPQPPAIDVNRAIAANAQYAVQLGWGSQYGQILGLLGLDASATPDAFAHAVAGWQQGKGLSVDGIIGPDTWSQMQPLLGPVPNPTGPAIAWGAKVSPEFKAKVISIAQDLGTSPDYLMAAMAFESAETFSPSIVNRLSGATGLIQFTTDAAKSVGTTIADLKQMTAVQQLDYVKRYFQRYAGRLNTLDDVYMVILWPRAFGQPADTILFSSPSKEYQQNQGLDADHDGHVTKAEAAAAVRAKLVKGQQPEFEG